MRVALAGCGDIARHYAHRILSSEFLALVGAPDVVPGRAEAFVREHGGTGYASVGALLADDAVEAVVNLTTPQAHAEVTAASLEAGKHVHSEKPLALRYDEATELVELAERRGVCLSCSPATLLGEAQQTAWKLVREGAIGTIRVAYAEANWGRIESWHPSPTSLYSVGPLVDVGIYPLTLLTAMFGPARRVLAYGALLAPDRVTLDGAQFRPGAPDFVVAVVELDGGLVVRLTSSFYVGHHGKQRGLELHGDGGSLYLATWGEADSRLELSLGGEEYSAVPLVREPYHGIEWGRALTELADSVAEGRPSRASGEQAAHVVEILCAVEESARTGGAVEIRSDFPRPPPLEWAL